MMNFDSVMERITNMPEFFVANNDRTPFKDNPTDWPHSSNLSGTTVGIDNQFNEVLDSNVQQQITKQLDASTVAAVAAAAAQLTDQVSGIDTDSEIPSRLCQQIQAQDNVSDFNMSSTFNAQNQPHLQMDYHTRSSIAVHTIIEINETCASPASISNLHVPDPLSSSTEQSAPPTCKATATNLLRSLNNLSSLNDSLNDQATSHHSTHQLQSKLALETVTNEANLFNDDDDDDNNMNFEATLNNSTTQSSNDSKHDLNDFLSDDLFLRGANNTSLLNHLDSNLEPQQSLFMQDQPQTSNYPSSFRETYSIISSNVLFIDLVRTVLVQLGYTTTDLINAKSELLIRNWKPIALDQVADNKKATVEEILGEISNVATLRIKLYSSPPDPFTEWTESMTRQVVLALTQTMSQLALAKLCNISQPLISSIVRGNKRLGRRKCAEFGRWYMNYIKNNSVDSALQQTHHQQQPQLLNQQQQQQNQQQHLQQQNLSNLGQLGDSNAANIISLQSNGNGSMISNSSSIGGPGRGAAGCSRLVYDKNREIPQLKSWFATNTTPTNELLEQYCQILNDDPLRRDRPEVTVKALRNWWKNERQKLGIRQRDVRPKLES